MYWVKTPELVQTIFPSILWVGDKSAKKIHLTFDDGPDEAVTPEVLEILKKSNAKATFFCVGQKAEENPSILKQIISEDHAPGNHTYNHLKGRKTETRKYISNAHKAKEIIDSRLFRPPYGSLTWSQFRQLKQTEKIVMWTVLPGDFDKTISKEEVLSRAVRQSGNGSIVVFHDNKKFKEKMLFALQGFIDHFKSQNYTFESLQDYAHSE